MTGQVVRTGSVAVCLPLAAVPVVLKSDRHLSLSTSFLGAVAANTSHAAGSPEDTLVNKT